MRKALADREELPDAWESTTAVLSEAMNKVFGVSSVQRKEETWWWNDGVQEGI